MTYIFVWLSRGDWWLRSFPTRRSSDLARGTGRGRGRGRRDRRPAGRPGAPHGLPLLLGDRKSTRLNSSHVSISYAVFCLKKKNKVIELRSKESSRNTLKRVLTQR